MIDSLWNIGLKVDDLDREIAFLERVGATSLLRERLAFGGGELDYAVLTLGGVRLLLFPTVVFEDQIAGGVRPGLTHAVFEVDDLEAEYERIRALGAEVLIEPTFVSAGFGSRRLAFFRSPGGFVFEIMQVIERRL
jgi:catechol 2,3-dioxygenase-like lactoylglutathione lyase family enzyme